MVKAEFQVVVDKKMTALITVDCLGKRFDVRILTSEPENQPMINGETTTEKHVTTIEISNEDKLPEVDGNDEIVLETVGELRQMIADFLQIEPDTAKIIHRGKLIGTNKIERLSTLRFKDKDVIKVMGRAVKTDPGFSSLITYERYKLVKLNNIFEQNGKDLDLLERNFLDGNDRAEMIKKTEKILRNFNEAAEKHLEAIDALNIFDDNTSEEQKKRQFNLETINKFFRNREKRKQMIDGILGLLNLNDKYLHRLDDYRFKVEHPDEGR